MSVFQNQDLDDTVFEIFAEFLPDRCRSPLRPHRWQETHRRDQSARRRSGRSSRKSGTPTGIFWKHRPGTCLYSITIPPSGTIPCFSISKKPSKKRPRRYEQRRKQRFTRRAALSRLMEIMRWTNTKAVWTSDRPKRLWPYLATRHKKAPGDRSTRAVRGLLCLRFRGNLRLN